MTAPANTLAQLQRYIDNFAGGRAGTLETFDAPYPPGQIHVTSYDMCPRSRCRWR